MKNGPAPTVASGDRSQASGVRRTRYRKTPAQNDRFSLIYKVGTEGFQGQRNSLSEKFSPIYEFGPKGFRGSRSRAACGGESGALSRKKYRAM